MCSRVCPVCSRTFDSKGKRIYCSDHCYAIANAKLNRKRYREKATQDRWSWSIEQAGRLYNICYDKDQTAVLDRLAKYVYNNYKQKKG